MYNLIYIFTKWLFYWILSWIVVVVVESIEVGSAIGLVDHKVVPEHHSGHHKHEQSLISLPIRDLDRLLRILAHTKSRVKVSDLPNFLVRAGLSDILFEVKTFAPATRQKEQTHHTEQSAVLHAATLPTFTERVFRPKYHMASF